MPIKDVIAKFPNVRSKGRGYISDCPLHPEDESPLRIRLEFGRLELECRRGCPDHKIAAALGLSAADLMDLDEFDVDDDGDDYDDDGSTGDAPDNTRSPEDEDGDYRPWFYGMYGEKIRSNYYDEEPLPTQLAAAADRPELRKLFGEFWLETELCILFADTGKGKSILAVQIADSITRGAPVAPLGLEVPPQRVLYFDYELSHTMFAQRYSYPSPETGKPVDIYPFSMEFRRATPSMDTYYPAGYDSFSEYMYASFVERLERSKAKIVIIDNITFLNNKTNERAGGAFRLIGMLRQLKHEHGLSILALAHTPKRRYSRGLTVDDLQGSKMLSNFADNIFAIGESCLGDDIRYLKQIKPRNTELVYGASNVCTYKIRKKGNFLGFEFTGFSREKDHRQKPSISRERRAIINEARKLYDSGLSMKEVAERLGISKSTVYRYLNMD
jgi:hypothetical protein